MKTIFSKIFSGYFLVAVVLSILIVVFSSEAIKKNYINSLSKNLKVVSEILEPTIIDLLEKKDVSGLENYIKNTGEKIGIRITLIDFSGKVIADSDESSELMKNHMDRPEIIQALIEKSGTSIRYSETVKMDMLYFARVIESDNGKWILRNSLYLEKAGEPVAVIVKKVLIIGLVFLLVALIVSFYISKRIADPIRKLSSAARDIAAEKFELPVEIKSNDEIKELADSFNYMAVEIKELLNVKKELVSNVSHELKTPLSAIKGFAETLEETTKDVDSLHYIEVIKRNTERLISIVDDLLLLSKMEEQKDLGEFVKVNIDEIIENSIKVCSIAAEKRNIDIVYERKSSATLVQGDSFKLEQMMINLIDNAVKYSDKGKVVVGCETSNGKVNISVTDSGMGIPEKDCEHIFERFYVVDKSRSRKLGGTGLGLSIVKHIAIQHGGQVFVESSVEKGTKFTVNLPL